VEPVAAIAIDQACDHEGSAIRAIIFALVFLIVFVDEGKDEEKDKEGGEGRSVPSSLPSSFSSSSRTKAKTKRKTKREGRGDCSVPDPLTRPMARCKPAQPGRGGRTPTQTVIRRTEICGHRMRHLSVYHFSVVNLM